MTWRECADKILKKYYADVDQIDADEDEQFDEKSDENSTDDVDSYKSLEDSTKRTQIKNKISRRLSVVFRLDVEYFNKEVLVDNDLSSEEEVDETLINYNSFSEKEFDLFCFLLENIDPGSANKNKKAKKESHSTPPKLLIQIRRYNKWELLPITTRRKLLSLIKALWNENNTIYKYIPPILESSLSDQFEHIQEAILLPRLHNIKNNLSQIRKYFSANGSMYSKATDYDIVINTFNNQEFIQFDKEFSELLLKYNGYTTTKICPQGRLPVHHDCTKESYQKKCALCKKKCIEFIQNICDPNYSMIDTYGEDILENSLKVYVMWRNMLYEHYVNIIHNYLTMDLFFCDTKYALKYLKEDILGKLDTNLTDLLDQYSPYTGGRLCPFPYTNAGFDEEIRNWKIPEIELYSFEAIFQKAMQERKNTPKTKI